MAATENTSHACSSPLHTVQKNGDGAEERNEKNSTTTKSEQAASTPSCSPASISHLLGKKRGRVVSIGSTTIMSIARAVESQSAGRDGMSTAAETGAEDPPSDVGLRETLPNTARGSRKEYDGSKDDAAARQESTVTDASSAAAPATTKQPSRLSSNFVNVTDKERTRTKSLPPHMLTDAAAACISGERKGKKNVSSADVGAGEPREDEAEVISDAVTMMRVNSKGILSALNEVEEVIEESSSDGGSDAISNSSASVTKPPSSSSLSNASDIHRVHSMPVLARPPPTTKASEVVIEGGATASFVSSANRSSVAADPDGHRNPSDYLQSLLSDNGYPTDPVPAADASAAGYFLEHTAEQIASYDGVVTAAVRSGDVPRLRSMLEGGRDLQCSNRFGESIVHMACRRGSLEVVKFLLNEAGVSVRVRDDLGRTPLHDACWTTKPAFELVKTIVRREPDLLLVSDRRGHTPLGYVRRDDWGAWVRFLDENRDLVIPRVLVEPK